MYGINRDPVETYLIHILFGSTNKCNWQSESRDELLDLNIKEGDSENLIKLKTAYQEFLDM